MTFSRYVPAFSSENKPYTFSVGWLTKKYPFFNGFFIFNVLKLINSRVKGKKVLIVDDNILNIKVLEKAIKDLELIIDSVTSGAAAIKKVINEEYDLILMDIMMPQMNGEETLREMQNIGNFKTPVIAVTADAVSGAKEKYLQEGFIEYIAKPFNKREINDLIINILTKKEKINWDEVEEVVITENDEK